MKFNKEKLNCLILKNRVGRGYTQTYMSQELGISQKAYSYLESGRCKLDVRRFIQIAELLDIHPMELINSSTTSEFKWQKDIMDNKLKEEIVKLKETIVYLESHNNFLKELINKLMPDNKH